MPQGGRPPPGKPPATAQQSQNLQPTAGGEPNQPASSWQRSSGRFSGAAKKEYLKWKRQQKSIRAEESGSDAGADVNTQQTTSKGWSKTTSSTAGQLDASGNSSPACAAHPPHVRKQRCPTSAQADSATQPLHYRPLTAVPAAPFSLSSMAPSLHSPTAPNDTTAAAAEPVAGDVAAGSNSSSGGGDGGDDAAGVAYMPQLDPAEVGFTAESFALTMPTRPRWQGVVSTAEELHALEEAEFAAWQAALPAQALQLSAQANRTGATAAANTATALDTELPAHAYTPSVHAPASAAGTTQGTDPAALLQQQQQSLADRLWPVSSYEGRLEYWRQLWRTLEMSDIICMVVDARNPLLHFSHALYRHITQDHQLPLVLLLNKCDLIPAAAATAWRDWLQQQLPRVAVIPVSAAKDQAAATASQVLSAVLQQQVVRNGQDIKVQQWVGMSADELMLHSVQRNTHAKRHHEPLDHQQQQPQQQKQHQHQQPTTDPGHTTSATASSDDDCDWSTKPNRGVRKSGRKPAHHRAQQQKLAARQAQPGKLQQQRQQQSRRRRQSRASDIGSDTDEGTGGQDSDVGASDDADQQGAVQTPSNGVVGDALGYLTLERRLSSSAASGSGGSTAAAAATVTGGVLQSRDVQWVAQQDDVRPVVVGMLGEPNVGKSSTLNALLGAHRVAVSSHPGRTKHYQTHYMSDKLVLVDCPGIVFPRLHVSPAMQVLFGSSPIASCREPYAVVRYLAEASWPRLQDTLKLAPHLRALQQQEQHADEQHAHTEQQQCQQGDDSRCASSASAALRGGADDSWSPSTLCEALAVKRHWVLPRSGRLDTYRAANWLLRAALAGQHSVGLAFLPPAAATDAAEQQ